MLYHLLFSVEYPSTMSQKELFAMGGRGRGRPGCQEGRSGRGSSGGVGSRRVVAIVDVDGPDTLDQILMDLPIMQAHGQQIDVTPLRRYEDFATDLKQRAG
ncbi:MAG: muconolactone Delta-isomerase family protein [Burkholderiales bacterium]